jgi:hypothetical protein
MGAVRRDCLRTLGSQSRGWGLLQEGEGSFWEGAAVPVDGVQRGGALPGQMVSRLPALEAKWILMKSQPWC